MFLSLALIIIVGVGLGYIFNEFNFPKLLAYFFVGILFSSSLLNLIDQSLIDLSNYLRQIAVVIILTRSGLSLDLKKLKKAGLSAILICFDECFV